MDPGSSRLLPSLYLAVRERELDDRLRKKLKGIYRHTWVKNQILLREARAVLDGLSAAGIPAMALKGIPLLLHYYRDVGARPMDDIDILVPREKVSQTKDQLVGMGWKPTFGGIERFLKTKHSAPFSRMGLQEMDLHWDILREGSWVERRFEDLWSQRRNIESSQLEGSQPDAATLLFLVMCHGLRWNPVHPVRWMADAWRVIQYEGMELQWNRFIQLAGIYRLRYTALCGLAILARLGTKIPSEVWPLLDTPSPALSERLEYLSKTRRWGGLMAQYYQYKRNASADSFAGFLQAIWNVPHWGRLPGEAWRRMRTRLK